MVSIRLFRAWGAAAARRASLPCAVLEGGRQRINFSDLFPAEEKARTSPATTRAARKKVAWTLRNTGRRRVVQDLKGTCSMDGKKVKITFPDLQLFVMLCGILIPK